jgi:hypothetical protein
MVVGARPCTPQWATNRITKHTESHLDGVGTVQSTQNTPMLHFEIALLLRNERRGKDEEASPPKHGRAMHAITARVGKGTRGDKPAKTYNFVVAYPELSRAARRRRDTDLPWLLRQSEPRTMSGRFTSSVLVLIGLLLTPSAEPTPVTPPGATYLPHWPNDFKSQLTSGLTRELKTFAFRNGLGIWFAFQNSTAKFQFQLGTSDGVNGTLGRYCHTKKKEGGS